MKIGMLAAAVATVLLGSSPSPAAAQADVQLETGSAEINGIYQGCGENIRYTGTVRFVYMKVSSGAGPGFGNVHVVDANVAGVGETTGTNYRLVYVLGERGEGVPAEQFGGSYEMTIKIVGGGQIYGQKWVGRWTRTPNGDITVSFEEVKQDWGCPA